LLRSCEVRRGSSSGRHCGPSCGPTLRSSLVSNRLGRERLRPDAARIDPHARTAAARRGRIHGPLDALGVGSPTSTDRLPDIVGVAIGIVVLGGALATFFLSLLRLHRQMVDVKANELAIARGLYADAYEPVRKAQTLEALERQHSLWCCRCPRETGTSNSRMADRPGHVGERNHDCDERRRGHHRATNP
jgi:hypothetical protein